MRSHAPDPYAPRRAYWPALRRFARWAVWSLRGLNALGLLQHDGRTARWLAQEVGRLEHFLRCMLVIACQARRAASAPAPPSTPSNSAAPLLSSSPSGEAAPMREPIFPRFDNPPRPFSLSLAAFGHKASPPETVRNHRPRAPGRTALTPAQRLAARINAVIAAMENIELHADRMARRIARLGLKLKRPATRRPANASPLESDLAPPRAPDQAVAVFDSS